MKDNLHTSTCAYNGDGLGTSRTTGGVTADYVWDVWNNYFRWLLGEKFRDLGTDRWQALAYVCYIGTENGVLVITPEDPRLKYCSW